MYYILEYPDSGTCYAHGGGYEFYPYTRASVWPASALPYLRKKAARIGGTIRQVQIVG